MNNKKEWEEVEMQVINFSVEDVIVTSDDDFGKDADNLGYTQDW